MGDLPTLNIEIANLVAEWAPDLARIERLSFPMANPDELLTEDDIRAYARTFPEGYFVALEDERPVGQGAGIYLDFDFDNPQHTLHEITGEHQCGNHDPGGEWYYGTGISVHPRKRHHGIGRMLYEARKNLVIENGKRGIVAGASLPGYYHYKNMMTAHTYVEKVVARELLDPTLTFQLNNGFEVRGMIENNKEDEADDGWAALIVWEAP